MNQRFSIGGGDPERETIRRFTDAKGLEWSVYAVVNPPSREGTRAEFRPRFYALSAGWTADGWRRYRTTGRTARPRSSANISKERGPFIDRLPARINFAREGDKTDGRGSGRPRSSRATPSLGHPKSKSAALARGAQQFRYPIPDGSAYQRASSTAGHRGAFGGRRRLPRAAGPATGADACRRPGPEMLARVPRFDPTYLPRKQMECRS